MASLADTWVVILAAGASARFGGPKHAAAWQGGTLLSHALDVARAVCGPRVIVVSGRYELTLPADIVNVHNAAWAHGLGSSVKAGMEAAISRDAGAVLMLPVDQPLLNAAHLRALVARIDGLCVFTRDGAVDGPPVAVPRNCFDLLGGLQGDRGLKSVVADYDVIEAPGMLEDVDTPEALAALTARISRA